MRPRIYRGLLSGRVFVATRYHTNKNGVTSVSIKYDITDEILALLVGLPNTVDAINELQPKSVVELPAERP